MFFNEDGLARHLPEEEMLKRRPVPEPSSRGQKEQTITARPKTPAPVGTESGKPDEQLLESNIYALADLTPEAFQSQTDPQKKHEMLVAMITELGNEERAKTVREKLLKMIVNILREIGEPSLENAVIMQARARRERDPMGQLINRLPKEYRVTVDTAYMTARDFAGVRYKTGKPNPTAGEHSIATPPPVEKTTPLPNVEMK